MATSAFAGALSSGDAATTGPAPSVGQVGNGSPSSCTEHIIDDQIGETG